MFVELEVILDSHRSKVTVFQQMIHSVQHTCTLISWIPSVCEYIKTILAAVKSHNFLMPDVTLKVSYSPFNHAASLCV